MSAGFDAFYWLDRELDSEYEQEQEREMENGKERISECGRNTNSSEREQ